MLQYADDEILARYQGRADAMKSSVLNTPNMDLSTIRGTVYYVSANGNDTTDGRSPATAFRSIGRLKQLKLNDGDAVLFRRGDLFRGSSWELPDGITVSAWGKGEKPTICASPQDFADPSIWLPTEYPGIWRCAVPLENVGLITFDHDPQTLGKYDVLCGWLVCPVVDAPSDPVTGQCPPAFTEKPPLHLKNDLEFWTDNQNKILYFRSDRNPGERFHRIEIAPGEHALQAWGKRNVTIDNLHVTLAGKHGISGMDDTDLEVTNCVLDYIGGSLLWEQCPFSPNRKNVRFGNAIEIFGGCSGYRVFNNWIYQIYDTGITHQCNDQKDKFVTHENVEYRDNLIEFCFWSIEYYNTRNKYGITRNIYVHDNFCRFGGDGWGCRLRKHVTPMYSLSFDADENEKYVTENNVFQFSRGFIVFVYGKKQDPAGFVFKHNTYIQYEDQFFSRIFDIKSSVADAEKTMREIFHEEDADLYVVKKQN